MKHNVELGETYADETKAELAVKGMKLMLPFRNWCAIQLADGWHVCDSIRKARHVAKKAGAVGSVNMLCFGRD